MAAIAIQDVGRAVFVTPPSWSKKAVILKKASFPKGVTPAHLQSYVENFKKAVAGCKPNIKKGQGAATVQGFNACISAQLK